MSDIEIDARKWAVEQAMAWAKSNGDSDITKVQELACSLAAFVLGPRVMGESKVAASANKFVPLSNWRMA